LIRKASINSLFLIKYWLFSKLEFLLGTLFLILKPWLGILALSGKDNGEVPNQNSRYTDLGNKTALYF